MPGGGGGLPPGRGGGLPPGRGTEGGGGGRKQGGEVENGEGEMRRRMVHNNRLPQEIFNGLRFRQKNRLMIQLSFEKVPAFPDEEAFWKWFGKSTGIDKDKEDEEVMDIVDYFEREMIERKYYVCFKNEEGADWVEQNFSEEGLLYNDVNHGDHNIKVRRMGDMWKTISVRGVSPTTPIEEVKDLFLQYGDVKDVKFLEWGKMKVKCNRITLKLKLEQGKKLPVFIYKPIKQGFYARWEISYPGSPKVCLLCFEEGHLRRECVNQGPTMTQIRQGEKTWAQVLGTGLGDRHRDGLGDGDGFGDGPGFGLGNGLGDKQGSGLGSLQQPALSDMTDAVETSEEGNNTVVEKENWKISKKRPRQSPGEEGKKKSKKEEGIKTANRYDGLQGAKSTV